MISIDILMAQNRGLDRQELERWILNEWVRPERHLGGFLFQDIDVARVKLIRELRQDLDIDEGSLPVILSLMDQLYELRRRFQALGDAIRTTAPDDLQSKLAAYIVLRAGDGLQ
jgi:chaperone modulatory protein CbpM